MGVPFLLHLMHFKINKKGLLNIEAHSKIFVISITLETSHRSKGGCI